jgi:serine/threonine protein kinase
MEICEKAEAFVDQDDDIVFDHTRLILRRDNEYFYARTDWRILDLHPSAADISQLELNKIPMENVWPPMDPRFTPAPDPLPPNCYVKQPSLLYYSDTPASLEPARQVLAEVEACEVLQQHPHPNIAQYFGCVTMDGKITGLCFHKYPITLSQKLKEATPFDKAFCLEGIESGVRHMHSLGLIHNDLNPRNIMMDGERPVIIDFDSCKREGDELGLKAGTSGWELEGIIYAKPENDYFGLSKIREIMMGGEDGKPEEQS